MAGRYSGWVAKKGASSAALSFGRKLLAALQLRRKTPGVKSLVDRVTLDDGTIVEASFIADIPRIRVYPANAPDLEECTLYVESGLLDLGPNIAGDAGERFNRGAPQFDSSPATLHFGTGVDCPDEEPGLNGRLQVNASGVGGQCLPESGASAPSRLSDPTKKQAQALLPASCWSGLMQRYVQAVYGGTALDYAATATALTIHGLSIDASRCVGLIAHNEMLRFVVFEPDSGEFSVYRCAPKDACFDACLKLWAKMPSEDAEERARKAKVLTISLSGCRFGQLLGTLTTGISGNTHFSKRPAMHFGDDGRTAAVVLESGGTATAYSLVFSIDVDDGALSVEVDNLASGPVLNGPDDIWPLYVAGVPSRYGSQVVEKSGFTGAEAIAFADSFDFPVYATCVTGGFNVVMYSLLVSTSAPVESDGCDDGFERPTNIGTSPPCSSGLDSFTDVVSGYYCTGPGGVVWSTVQTTEVIEVDGDLVIKAADTISKALAIVPSGPETESSTVQSDLYPQALYEMWASNSGGAAAGDCLYLGGTSPHPIDSYTSTWVAPTTDCSVSYSVVWGDCIGPSSGTGFPTYLSVGTCDTRYESTSYTGDCVSVVRERSATVHTAYAAGEVNSPRPHVISMCAGSYEFVVERYSQRSLRGVVADKVSDWTDSESRYVCDFEATIVLLTAVNPGGLCSEPEPSVIETTHGTFDGHYEYDFQGYELLRRAKMDDFMAASYVAANGIPLLRGIEAYKATSSYGQEVEAEGSISWNTGTDAPESHEPDDAEPIKDACPFFEALFVDAIDDDPVATITAASAAVEARWRDDGPDAKASMLDGYVFAGARSLLGASIFHTLQLERGASLNMDRETITGGYSAVSTPSFVGWA